MGATINIIQGLPPEAYDGEMVALDLEIYNIPEGKLHRPVGDFACLSVTMERDLDYHNGRDTIDIYQFYDPNDVREALARLDKGKWVFQNAKFDIRQLRRWAEVKPRKMWDTMIVDQGLFGGYYSSFDLGSLSLRWLKEYLPKDVRETFSKATAMDDAMKNYAAIDPLVTLRVAMAQMDYIVEEDVSFEHYWLADHPAVWAILDMRPVKLDTAGWSSLAATFAAEAARVQALYPDVKFSSTQKVNAALCAMLKRKNALKSTDEENLTELKESIGDKRPDVTALIDAVLGYRKAAKMASTYGDNWLRQYVEDGDYIWPDWKPVQALTGRMACGEPNMQNVPAREFPIFRTFFTASDARILVGADVAQQEPRILAKLSGDKFLTKTLQEGKSPHVAVGAEIFHDPNFSKKDPRYNLAKQANLGTSYGMTAYGLANKAGVPVEEAEVFIRHYFRQMSGVKSYIDSYRKLAYRQEYVQTLTGRRAWVNKYTRKWENNAINSPIQGTAADQTKIAVGLMHQWSLTEWGEFPLNLVVHDETVADVPVEHKERFAEIQCEAWQEAGRLTLGDDIPLVIDPFSGPNWGAKKE